jgi:branched-chain amino acid transport system substrate-binding protein
MGSLKAFITFLLLITAPVQHAALADDARRIGAVLGLTGPSSIIGQEIREGMQLCADPGTNLIVEDSQGLPVSGLSAFKKLVEQDKVDISVVTFSGVAGAVLPIAAVKQVPVILTLVSARGLIKDSKQDAFRFFTSGEQEGPIMARYLSSAAGVKRAAILHLEDEYGLSYANAFTSEFEGRGGAIIATEGYSRDTTDFRTVLARIKAKQVEAIYLIGHDSHALNIIRQAKELGTKEILASNWILASPTVRQGMEVLLEDVLFTSPDFYWAETPKQRNFIVKFSEKHGTPPTAYSALGCDVIDLIEQQPAKSIGLALRKLDQYDGTIGKVSSSVDGSLEFELYPVKFKEGRIVELKREVNK